MIIYYCIYLKYSFTDFLWFLHVLYVCACTCVCLFVFVGATWARSYKIGVIGNNWLVGNAVFSKMDVSIFLIFCIELGDCKGRKVTELDFWKKFLIWRYSRKRLQISPKSDTLIFGWLVGNAVFSETALRIFLIFCMKLGDYKGRKVTEPDFWKKFLIRRLMSSCFLTICSPVNVFLFVCKCILVQLSELS